MRPGMRRTNCSRQAMMPRYGPPYSIGVPSDCPSATAMSAPVIARPLQQAQADRIERCDEQRAGVVGDLGERRDVFEAAEEVRLLHDDAGGLVVDGGRQVRPASTTPLGRADGDQLRAEVRKIRLQIVCRYSRMHARRRRRPCRAAA